MKHENFAIKRLCKGQIEKITDSKLTFRALALRQSMQTMSEFPLTSTMAANVSCLGLISVLSWYFLPINSFYTNTFSQHYYFKKNDAENELTARERGKKLSEENSKENACATKNGYKNVVSPRQSNITVS